MPQGIKTVTTVLGGATFALSTLPATAGTRTLTWLFRLAGEPVGRVGAEVAGLVVGGKTKDATKGEGKREIDVDRVIALFAGKGDVLAKAIAELARTVDRPATTRHIKTLLTGLTRQLPGEKPMPVDFDWYFSANYVELFALTSWAVRENYGGFFAANPLLRDLGARLGQAPGG